MKTTKDVGISGDRVLVIDMDVLSERAERVARIAPLTKEGNNDRLKFFKDMSLDLVSIPKILINRTEE